MRIFLDNLNTVMIIYLVWRAKDDEWRGQCMFDYLQKIKAAVK